MHLMIAPADPYLAAFADAGADIITVHRRGRPASRPLAAGHQGAGQEGRRVAQPGDARRAPSSTCSTGSISILLMTVNPGFGGQAFIPAVVDKIRRVKAMIGIAADRHRGRRRRHAGDGAARRRGRRQRAGRRLGRVQGRHARDLRRQHRRHPLRRGRRARQSGRLTGTRSADLSSAPGTMPILRAA